MAKTSASYGNSVSATSISGLGDEAYYFGTDAMVGLSAKQGSVAFEVAVYAQMPVAKRPAAGRTLASRVFSQLWRVQYSDQLRGQCLHGAADVILASGSLNVLPASRHSAWTATGQESGAGPSGVATPG